MCSLFHRQTRKYFWYVTPSCSFFSCSVTFFVEGSMNTLQMLWKRLVRCNTSSRIYILKWGWRYSDLCPLWHGNSGDVHVLYFIVHFPGQKKKAICILSLQFYTELKTRIQNMLLYLKPLILLNQRQNGIG